MERTDTDAFPLHAITQRPMVMYHSWDSQNAWLRQILADERAVRERGDRRRSTASTTATGRGSSRRTVAHPLPAFARWKASSRRTVWTWNAVGKQAGAWGLAHDAPEATTGFLLNHLIAEHLAEARGDGARRLTNSDPVTGQAAWYDVRVRLVKCATQRDRARGRRSSRCRRCRSDASRADPLARADDAMKLGLLIDLDTCVGCHACATACKEWNGASAISGPLTDCDPYGSRSLGRVVQPRPPLRGRRVSGVEDRSTSRCRACIARTPRA